jgi:hypothetical protein
VEEEVAAVKVMLGVLQLEPNTVAAVLAFLLGMGITTEQQLQVVLMAAMARVMVAT